MSEAKQRNVNLTQFTLFTQSTKDPDKLLRMSFGVSGTGFPFINADADENIPEKTKENNFGKLTARLGGAIFFSLLEMLVFAKKQSPNWKMGLQNFHTFVNGKKLDKPAHVNDVMVGTDSEGCVWISIVENGRDSARFFFGPGEWHSWKKADGEIASRQEMNHYAVNGFTKGIGPAVASLMSLISYHGTAVDEKFPENKEAAQAGGSRPWNNNNQGGNNWKDRNGGNSNWKNNNYQKKDWQPRQGGNWQKGNNNWQNRNNQGNWQKGNNNWKNNNNQSNNWNNNRQNDQKPQADDDFEDLE